MTQTFSIGDQVIVTEGPDAGRRAVVLANYADIPGYPAPDIDGARISFGDGRPSLAVASSELVAVNPGSYGDPYRRDYGARYLRRA
jgi:hypothetical protein